MFNADQIEGLPARLLPEPWDDPTWDACEVAESILQQSGARRRHGGNKAYYSPSLDVIQLPERGAFATADGYYQVALHELTHWTGAAHRLDRDMQGRFGDRRYAAEELVAELGAHFLAAEFDMEAATTKDTARYLAQFYEEADPDYRALLRNAEAASDARTVTA